MTGDTPHQTAAERITDAVVRMFLERGEACLREFTLRSGRRVDIIALGRDGRFAFLFGFLLIILHALELVRGRLVARVRRHDLVIGRIARAHPRVLLLHLRRQIHQFPTSILPDLHLHLHLDTKLL